MLSIGYKKADIKLSVGYSSKRFGMTTLISSISKTGFKFKKDRSVALSNIDDTEKLAKVIVDELCDYIEYHQLRGSVDSTVSLHVYGDEPIDFGFGGFDVSGTEIVDELTRRREVSV